MPVAEIALLNPILQRAEIAVGVLQRPVNRRAGKAESGSVLKLHTHRQRVAVAAASPGGCLRAVALIDHADDVVAAQRAKVVHLLKRLDGRHHCAAPVGSESSFQILVAQRPFHMGVVAGVQVVRELGLGVADPPR